MKKVTITKIAEKIGCTHSTVSRALNNRAGVSAELRKKILQLVDQEHYLPRESSRVVAILYSLFPDVPDLYSSTLIQHLSLELRKQNLRSLIIPLDNIDVLADHFVCGTISLATSGQIAKVWHRRFAQPLLCINDYSNMLDKIYAVNSDDRTVIQNIARNLLLQGLRKIAVFSTMDDTLSVCARRRYFQDTSKNYGLQYEFIEMKTPITQKAMEAECNNLAPDIQAAVITSEGATAHGLQALRAVNRKMFTAGWVSPVESPFAPRPDLAVIQNLQAIAERAVEILKQALSGQKLPFQDHLIPYLQINYTS